MHRFFVEKEQIQNDTIEIIGTDIKHIKDVLRIKASEKIEIASEGMTYICEIEYMDKSKVISKIIDKNQGSNESNINITLYQGLAKGSKMDLIIQKCTEIGVKEFYPLASHRSVVKIKDIKKEQSKVERWNTIADEAAKQSKRDILPIVKEILTFDEMILLLKDKENILVPYEDEKQETIRKALKSMEGNDIHLIIGPEGGFEPDEIQRLKEIGAKIVTLGPRILRTETAGIVSATITLYELGDLGVV
ncbi:16S rRNA (uracil(1498)-N(3))-methyltransferase [Tissierella pigra]|uniref:Ribosomal RNA small subunit methyltransferase E n=1 Tax=Tissierella pigra TaxID=2607614 RepID=A0A6N7Y2C4_9FIRM|nr:RsmE family RNA methyltransferase [Tissierella pigra]MBU5427125.1 16S rRNA (uracil(1498)-N(3))-methyltransferase [Tissierella pigra]MSU02905.1 16S rRNA (uracil(1498)-N(3))-methyltransferase [Tissierella pigra]